MAATDAVGSADLAFCVKDYTKAIAFYTEAIADERNRREVDLFRKRAGCFIALHKYKEAYEDISVFLKRKPSSISGYVIGGKVLVKLKRYEDAAKLYRRGLDVDRDSEKIEEGLHQLENEIMSQFEAQEKKMPKPGNNVLKLCSQEPYPGDERLGNAEDETLQKWGLKKLPELLPRLPDLGMSTQEYEHAKQLKMAGNLVSALERLHVALEYDPANFALWAENAEWLFESGELNKAFTNCQVVPREFRSKKVWILGGKYDSCTVTSTANNFYFIDTSYIP